MEVDFIKTSLPIKDIISCQECPLSLNKKDEIVNLGTGNICTKTVFVLPYYNRNKDNKKANLLELLSKAYNDICGNNILNYHYVTILPKCYSNEIYTDNTYEIVQKSIYKCFSLLAAELKHYCPYLKKIVFCGTIFNNLLELDLSECFVDINIKIISNPIIYNSENKDKFINELKEVLYV